MQTEHTVVMIISICYCNGWASKIHLDYQKISYGKCFVKKGKGVGLGTHYRTLIIPENPRNKKKKQCISLI